MRLIHEILGFVSSLPDLIQAICVIIMTVITAIYARTTHLMFKTNQELVGLMKIDQENLSRPYIIVSVFVRGNLLALNIKNCGSAPARDLKLSIDSDFYQNAVKNETRNIKSLNAFIRPIAGFAPETYIDIMLGASAIFAPENHAACPSVFTITAEYNYLGKKYTELNTLDLRPWVGTLGSIDPVVDELKNISKEIANLKA